MGTLSRVMAGCFSMAAFAVAIVAGLAGGNMAIHVLGRALVAMILCYPVGLIVGYVCERVIALHMTEYEQKHPVPTEDQAVEQHEADTMNEKSKEQEDVLVV